jgi:hypothetical protein
VYRTSHDHPTDIPPHAAAWPGCRNRIADAGGDASGPGGASGANAQQPDGFYLCAEWRSHARLDAAGGRPPGAFSDPRLVRIHPGKGLGLKRIGTAQRDGIGRWRRRPCPQCSDLAYRSSSHKSDGKDIRRVSPSINSRRAASEIVLPSSRWSWDASARPVRGNAMQDIAASTPRTSPGAARALRMPMKSIRAPCLSAFRQQ